MGHENNCSQVNGEYRIQPCPITAGIAHAILGIVRQSEAYHPESTYRDTLRDSNTGFYMIVDHPQATHE